MLSEIPAPFCLKHLIQPCKGNARAGGKGGYEPLWFFSPLPKSWLSCSSIGLLARSPPETEQRTSSKVIISNLPDFWRGFSPGHYASPQTNTTTNRFCLLKSLSYPDFYLPLNVNDQKHSTPHDIYSITDCHRTGLLGRSDQMGISTVRRLHKQRFVQSELIT